MRRNVRRNRALGEGVRRELNPAPRLSQSRVQDRYTTDTVWNCGLAIADSALQSAIRNPKSAIAIARPGLEPGTPRSKRGMMSVSPSSRERVESGESRVESQKPRGRPAFSDSRLWTLDSRLSGSPTRTRTRNSSLEARNDVRFTIGPWKSRELRVESPEPENSSGSQPWTLSPRPFPAEGMGFEPTRPRGRTV